MTAVLPPLLAQTLPDPSQATGSAEFWVFILVGAVSVGSALAMVLMRNPVHAALMLVVNFFTLAVLYAVLEAQFLAAVQVIVYAGAIMVLFLFVLMLIGVRREPRFSGSRIPAQGPIAVILGLLLVAALGYGIASPYMTGASACTPDAATAEAGDEARPCSGLVEANADGNTEGVGQLLFTRYVWPFEVTSVLLVIAAVGVMVIGRKREDRSELVDRTPAVVGAAAAAAEPEPAAAPAADDAEEGSAT